MAKRETTYRFGSTNSERLGRLEWLKALERSTSPILRQRPREPVTADDIEPMPDIDALRDRRYKPPWTPYPGRDDGGHLPGGHDQWTDYPSENVPPDHLMRYPVQSPEQPRAEPDLLGPLPGEVLVPPPSDPEFRIPQRQRQPPDPARSPMHVRDDISHEGFTLAEEQELLRPDKRQTILDKGEAALPGHVPNTLPDLGWLRSVIDEDSEEELLSKVESGDPLTPSSVFGALALFQRDMFGTRPPKDVDLGLSLYEPAIRELANREVPHQTIFLRSTNDGPDRSFRSRIYGVSNKPPSGAPVRVVGDDDPIWSKSHMQLRLVADKNGNPVAAIKTSYDPKPYRNSRNPVHSIQAMTVDESGQWAKVADVKKASPEQREAYGVTQNEGRGATATLGGEEYMRVRAPDGLRNKATMALLRQLLSEGHAVNRLGEGMSKHVAPTIRRLVEGVTQSDPGFYMQPPAGGWPDSDPGFHIQPPPGGWPDIDPGFHMPEPPGRLPDIDPEFHIG